MAYRDQCWWIDRQLEAKLQFGPDGIGFFQKLWEFFLPKYVYNHIIGNFILRLITSRQTDF